MEKTTININDKDYPFLLKQINNPPKEIYVYGNFIDLNQKMVTIVGTSFPTYSGRRETKRLVKRLVKKGYCIVTSFTQGVDEVVCETTLENNGKILVVIPGDIEKIRSKKYREKIKQILEKSGNVITEYNSFEQVSPEKYIEINRILCGLSKSLIIIEAGIASGTMITAEFALNQNREVYALIGSLKSAKKVGTNCLIKRGANPIISTVL